MPYLDREQRRFPRIRVNTPVRYNISGLPQSVNTVSSDISLGGICLSNDSFIAPHTEVGLEVNLLSRILRARGRVAWSFPLPHSDKYRWGVEFQEMPQQEKNYLKDYIDLQLGVI